MSDLQVLAGALAAAKGGSRKLDCAIAMFLGWQEREFSVRDEKSGQVLARRQWVAPGANAPGNVPAFSSDLDAALELCQRFKVDKVGCSWEEGRADATAGSIRESIQAPTPALALCKVALLHISKHPELLRSVGAG